MTGYHYLLVVLSITLSIICFCGIHLTEAHNGGISVDLIHRDSPKSPLYNSSETPFQRLTNAIHRSFNRVNHFYPQQVQGSPYPRSEITSSNGEFLMKYAIGSNHVFLMGLIDTGSNLIWLQCQPCDQCYKQTDPIFDPSKSTSYEKVLCSSNVCGLIPDHTCREPICQYNILYQDGSHSSGDVAFETFTLGSNVTNTFISFPHVLIGCGHDNAGVYSSSVSGVVGLGPGVLSLNSQLNNSFHDKFSYCLVPTFESNTTSILNFGEHALVSGPGTISTPLAYGPKGTAYYLTSKGMTVGGKRMEFEAEAASAGVTGNGKGNIIIDSGTTLTFLPEELYTRLESEVASHISLERVPSPIASLKLCYKSPPNSIEAPLITAHFTGADIVLNRLNTFVSVSNDVVCFAFSPSSRVFIFGYLAQMNFLVGYDRKENVVSFMPTECTKF